MTFEKAKEIIKKLGLTGKDFSKSLGRYTNYFSDMKSQGVPENIAIILTMIEKLIECGITNEEIIKMISSNIKEDK